MMINVGSKQILQVEKEHEKSKKKRSINGEKESVNRIDCTNGAANISEPPTSEEALSKLQNSPKSCQL